MGLRIAIIGTGISGLGAAWATHHNHEITVYEADDRVGGHSNTVDVTTPLGKTPVDTGFIVYNESTYPNLTRLFAHLGVATEESDMSFAFSKDRDFEYGASLGGVLAKPSNLLSGRFRRMLLDIDRFRRTGNQLTPGPNETIGELLQRHRFSEGFIQDYLYPMTGAIWSSPTADIAGFPASSILRFLSNHGLIEIVGRPKWRTVSGGSREYVDLLSSRFADRIRLSSPVSRVVRMSNEVLVESHGKVDTFDQVIIASHSDQALRMLGDDASSRERSLLSDIEYQPNHAVLHSDTNLMPRNKKVWSSWNAMAGSSIQTGNKVSLTYWMNRLQNLDERHPLLVTLNPEKRPADHLIHATFDYAHPRFDRKALAAQKGIAEIQGTNRTWFAGAYLGYGFHEDGLQSALNVSAVLGSPAPWHGTFEPVSSAMPVPRTLQLT